jgi:hypothetical protein
LRTENLFLLRSSLMPLLISHLLYWSCPRAGAECGVPNKPVLKSGVERSPNSHQGRIALIPWEFNECLTIPTWGHSEW